MLGKKNSISRRVVFQFVQFVVFNLYFKKCFALPPHRYKMLIERFHNVWFWISETSRHCKNPPRKHRERVICDSKKTSLTVTDTCDKL